MKHKYSKTPPDLKAAPIIIADSVIFCGALLVMVVSTFDI